jgi:hypothetical protein
MHICTVQSDVDELVNGRQSSHMRDDRPMQQGFWAQFRQLFFLSILRMFSQPFIFSRIYLRVAVVCRNGRIYYDSMPRMRRII